MRGAALGGIVGPFAFVGAWVVLGAVSDGYSPLHDPISDLAAVHSSTRPLMTAAFVVFAIAMGGYAYAVRVARRGPVWIAAAINAVATLGVAAFPLHHSATVDKVHGVFAGTGYVTLAAIALLSAWQLARLGLHRWARTAALAGGASAVALALTLTGSFEGLFQRAGLTAGDIWLVASAIAIRRGYWLSRPAPAGGSPDPPRR